MPVVTVELPAPTPPGVAHVLIDACSQTVREGRCVLATEVTSETPGARASVTWNDASERVAHVEVEVTSGDTRGSRRRTIAFKQSDARVERWRTVGLTIATLVGDVLHPNELGAPSENSNASHATDAAGQPAPPTAGTPAPSQATSATMPNADARSPLPATLYPSATKETQPPKDAEHAQRHTAWVSLLAVTGPGLDQGGWRFGGALALGYRPTKLPLFGRVAVAYAVRPTNSQGLSLAWETLSLGGGAAFALSALSLEPRVSLGVENVHAAVSDTATQASDSGNQLGVNVRGGIDVVWQWPRFGIVGSFEGWRAHAPTEVVVAGRNSGVSPAWGWDLGLGGRLYID